MSTEAPIAPPKEKHYRILKLSASNVKRLKAVSILPVGDVITVGGRNDQGKTSLLDAIMFAMAGAGTVCQRPIRDGQSQAEIVVDLGDLIVTKTFKSAGAPTLKVTTKDGVAVRSPQAILDGLASKIGFDPLSFTRMDSEKQLETLRKLVNLDFTAQNEEWKSKYDQRTGINRDADSARTRLKAMTRHVDAPAEESSVTELMGRLEGIRKKNEDNAAARRLADAAVAARSEQEGVIAGIETEIADLRVLILEKEASLKVEQSVLTSAREVEESRKQSAAALTDEDETFVKTLITDSQATNAKVRENAAITKLEKEADDLELRSRALTSGMDAIEKEQQELLSKAKFPLPGLSFNEDSVLLDGVPFTQAGQAKKIRASVAIGLALNPKLRVILIRDGSLLDDDSLKLVAEMAKENDAQVWIETVGEKGASVIIEDGEVKES